MQKKNDDNCCSTILEHNESEDKDTNALNDDPNENHSANMPQCLSDREQDCLMDESNVAHIYSNSCLFE